MDWADSPMQAEFRGQVRAFIQENLPQRYRTGKGAWQPDRKSADPEVQAAANDWARALGKRGWVAPAWPKEYGGAGLSPVEQFIFNQEMARAEAPSVGGQAVSQIGPAIIIHGTPEQKKQHLEPILAGEIAWAQGYSEPGAGSDLASLTTRAERDGDMYVINGQKIWTSGAQWADWLVALVRTDPDAPKHRGISFMLIEKNSPGLTIRPIYDITFEHHFNETFFEDVRVPVANRVGEENRGWYVGMTLLDFERSRIGLIVGTRKRLDSHIDFVNKSRGQWVRQDAAWAVNRTDIAQAYIDGVVAENFAFRICSMQARGLVPNYESSVAKMFVSELNQRASRSFLKAVGLWGQVTKADDRLCPLGGSLPNEYLRSISGTIAGGANEIQRNVIATRGLGLPRG